MSMVKDLLVYQGREQGHARDRGSHQEVPHGLPSAQVLQRADDQEAWDTSETNIQKTKNVLLDKTSDTALSLMKRTATPRRLLFTKDCRAKFMFTILLCICHDFPTCRKTMISNVSPMAATMDPDPLMIPVTVPKERVPASLGWPARSTATAEEMMLLGLSVSNKAIERVRLKWGTRTSETTQKIGANERLSWEDPSVCMLHSARLASSLLARASKGRRERAHTTKETPSRFRSQPVPLLAPLQPRSYPRHAFNSPSHEHAHEAEQHEERPGRHVVGLLGEDDQQHAQQGEEGHDHTGAPAAECVAHDAHDDAA